MDQKCIFCGSDLSWDEEKQKYQCSESCWKANRAPKAGISSAFSTHYRILLRTVLKLRREVAALKAINKDAYDSYVNAVADANSATIRPASGNTESES